jgi:hypothetical protein
MQNWLDPKSLQASTQGFIDGIDKVSEGWEPLLKATARCQLEAISLASRRAQSYMELPARIGACRTPQDLAGEQLRFWQAAVAQYVESCGRMMESCRALTPMPWMPWNFLQIAAGANGKSASEKRERDYISVREPDEVREEAVADKGSRRAA